MRHPSLRRACTGLFVVAVLGFALSGCSSASVSKDVKGTVSHLKTAVHSKVGKSLLHEGGNILHKGGSVLHKAGGVSGVLHKVVHAIKHVHLVRKLRCVFHGYRAVQDLRHKHPGWSALQLYEAARTCKR